MEWGWDPRTENVLSFLNFAWMASLNLINWYYVKVSLILQNGKEPELSLSIWGWFGPALSQLTTMEFETSALLGLFCYSSDFQLELSDMDILVEKDWNLLAFLSNCFSKSWKYNIRHIFTLLIYLGRRAQTEIIFSVAKLAAKMGPNWKQFCGQISRKKWLNWQQKLGQIGSKTKMGEAFSPWLDLVLFSLLPKYVLTWCTSYCSSTVCPE